MNVSTQFQNSHLLHSRMFPYNLTTVRLYGNILEWRRWLFHQAEAEGTLRWWHYNNHHHWNVKHCHSSSIHSALTWRFKNGWEIDCYRQNGGGDCRMVCSHQWKLIALLHRTLCFSLGSVYRNTEPISDILKYRYRHRRRYSQYRKIPNIDN